MDESMLNIDWDAPLDAETEAQIDFAMANARDWYDWEIAVSAEYVATEDLFVIALRSGECLAIRRDDLQGLADAPRDQAANVTLEASGSCLHWEDLDVDFSAAGLVEGRYGNERWMKGLEERRRKDASAALSQTA